MQLNRTTKPLLLLILTCGILFVTAGCESDPLATAEARLRSVQAPGTDHVTALNVLDQVLNELPAQLESPAQRQLLKDLQEGKRRLAGQSWEEMQQARQELQELVAAQGNAIAAAIVLRQKIESDADRQKLDPDIAMAEFSAGQHESAIARMQKHDPAKKWPNWRSRTLSKMISYSAGQHDLAGVALTVKSIAEPIWRIEALAGAWWDLVDDPWDQKAKLVEMAESEFGHLPENKPELKVQALLDFAFISHMLGDTDGFDEWLRQASPYLQITTKEVGYEISSQTGAAIRRGQCEAVLTLMEAYPVTMPEPAPNHLLQNCPGMIAKSRYFPWLERAEQAVLAVPKSRPRIDHIGNLLLTYLRLHHVDQAISVAERTPDLFWRSKHKADIGQYYVDQQDYASAEIWLAKAQADYEQAQRKKAERSKTNKYASRKSAPNGDKKALAEMAQLQHSLGQLDAAYATARLIDGGYHRAPLLVGWAEKHLAPAELLQFNKILDALPEPDPTPGAFFSGREKIMRDIAIKLIEQKQYARGLKLVLETESPFHIAPVLLALDEQAGESRIPTIFAEHGVHDYLQQLVPTLSLWTLPSSENLLAATQRCAASQRGLSKASPADSIGSAMTACQQQFDLARQERKAALLVSSVVSIVALNGMDYKSARKHLSWARHDYLNSAYNAIPQLRLEDREVIVDALTALTYAANGGVSEDRIFVDLYNHYLQLQQPHDELWAALTTEVGRKSLRGAAKLRHSPSELLALYPKAMSILEALPESEYRSQRLINAYLGKARLTRKSAPLKSIDSLLSAHAIAVNGQPFMLNYIQLLISNLFEDNTALIAANRGEELASLIKLSPENKHLDRLINTISYTTKDCRVVKALHEKQLALRTNPPSAGATINLFALYGEPRKIVRELRRLHCLTDAQLVSEDRDNSLLEVLARILPKDKRTDSPFLTKVEDIERRLEQARRSN